MATISCKFYRVRMPDGKEYADEGQSIRKVAKKHGVSPSNVTLGVDLLRTPDVSQYYQARRPTPNAVDAPVGSDCQECEQKNYNECEGCELNPANH